MASDLKEKFVRVLLRRDGRDVWHLITSNEGGFERSRSTEIQKTLVMMLRPCGTDGDLQLSVH
jgi:hypothetical protein